MTIDRHTGLYLLNLERLTKERPFTSVITFEGPRNLQTSSLTCYPRVVSSITSRLLRHSGERQGCMLGV